MNTKAFTLIELMLATILGMLVMIGSVGVIENMQRESQNFQSRITDNMTWVEANQRIAQLVRSSSYIELSNPIAGTDPVQYTTMTLRDYNDAVRGVFNNTPDGITYTNDATGIGNRDANNPFRNINATFADPATPANPQKGRASNGKQIETIVNYTVNYEAPSTMPFTSAISLGCRVAVAGETSDTWADIIMNSSGQLVHIHSVEQTADNRYIMTGAVPGSHAGYGEFYLIKLYNDGSLEWCRKFTRPYPWALPRPRYAYIKVHQTVDGGYAMVYEKDGDPVAVTDIVLHKTDDRGNPLWIQDLRPNIPLAYGPVTCPTDFQQTADGGYIIVGITDYSGASSNPSWPYNAEIYVVKTDSNGESPNGRLIKYGSNNYDAAFSIGQTTDGGYIIGGFYYGASDQEARIIKLKNDLTDDWTQLYSGYSYVRTVQQRRSGSGYIALMYTMSGANVIPSIVTTDTFGNALSTITYASNYASTDIAMAYYYSGYLGKAFPFINGSFTQTADGGYVIATNISTSTPEPYGQRDILLYKNDAMGGWTKSFVHRPTLTPTYMRDNEMSNDIEQTNDGGYIIVGSKTFSLSPASNPGGYVIKTDNSGDCPEATEPTLIQLPL